MVQVQSTWFPLIDRNPQTFVPNIFEAKDRRLQGGDPPDLPLGAYPSRVTIPVVVKTP